MPGNGFLGEVYKTGRSIGAPHPYNSLGTLFTLSDARTRSISAENPTGAPGAGGREASNLGPGRKGRPCIDLPAGSTTTLTEIAGPGIIQHIWLTLPDRTDFGEFVQIRSSKATTCGTSAAGTAWT